MFSPFPAALACSDAESALQPCEIRHLAIIVNLEYDPDGGVSHKVVHFDFRKLDVFSFGEEQNCLIGSIASVISQLSWNEVRTCT